MLGSMFQRSAVIAILSVPVATAIGAQRVSIDASLRTSDRSYVEATGEATVSVKPDQAVIDIGVLTDEPTASAAAAQNARQSDALFVQLRKLIAANDRIKSASYSVAPHYKYPKPGAPATIASYTATNVVEVTVDDSARVGKIIDAALESGANTIRSVDFRLKDPRATRSQALREASSNAKASAEAIAAGLGVHIVRLLSAQESRPEDEEFGVYKKVPPPPPGVAATEIAPGPIDVTAIVVVRAEVAQ